MQKQNDRANDFQGSKWYHSLVFIVLGLIGYLGFVWLRGNYLDALAMPLIFGFVWLAGMKQKLAWAVALVAFYVMLAVPAMAAGSFLIPQIKATSFPATIITFFSVATDSFCVK